MNEEKEIQQCEDILKDDSLGFNQRQHLEAYVQSLKLKLNISEKDFNMKGGLKK